MDYNIVCSPVAQQYKPKPPDSKKDYEEQLNRLSRHERMMWDDSPKNRSVRGDYFAFIHNNHHVTFHRIEGFSSPHMRLPSWANNVGHGDRNVLYLSSLSITISWNEWLHLGGWQRAQGTQNMHNPSQLLTFLENKIPLEL